MVFCCDASADGQEQDTRQLPTRGRTLICKSSVMNMGNNPGAVGVAPDAEPVGMLRVRQPRTYLLSHTMALTVAMKCIPLNARPAMESRFQAAEARGKASVAHSCCICATPVQWFEEAFGPQYRISRVLYASDVLSRRGQFDDLSEFYLMDAILSRDLMTTPDSAEHQRPDEIVWPPAYDDLDLEDKSAFKYRTLIAYLPGAGIFYCARERG